MTTRNYPPELRKELGMPDQGVMGTSVADSGPAGQAGIRGPKSVTFVGSRAFPVGIEVIVAVEGQEEAGRLR